MKRRISTKLLLGMLLTLLLIGCGSSTSKVDADLSAKVTRVVDGDTIHVLLNSKEETVRFLLVDTPETVKPNTPPQPFGKEASDFTKHLLTGKTVELEQDVTNGPDKYGRLLYYVYVDGKSVQELLLEKGLARVAYIYPPNVKYVDRYQSIQKKAQQAGVGIWSIENYAQRDGYHAKGTEPSDSRPTAPAAEIGPQGQTIKGNINSRGEKIYHLQGDRYYNQTVPEQWFFTEKEAKDAGFRPAK